MPDKSLSIKYDGASVSYVAPFITMVFLFLIVGFLTTANTQFQMPLKALLLSDIGGAQNTCATLITFSWFLAYPVCGGLGARWINRFGYRTTLMRGLMLMILGLLLMISCSLTAVHFPDLSVGIGSYSIPDAFILFLAGSFVLGSSATVLQVVINPYLTACTVRGTQPVQRLAIGGSANAIGTTVAPYFVTGMVFGGLSLDSITADQLTWPFVMLIVVISLMTISISRVDLPDIKNTRANEGVELTRSVWSFRHLTLGVIAIFFYVGAEVCIGANINMYAGEKGLASPALLATIYWGGILVGRLVGSSMSKISPRVQLTVTTLCAAVLAILAISIDDPWLLAGVGLFHSIMWGCIFTLAIAALGKYTSAASGVFMIGVVGGAVFPLIQGLLADIMGGWRFTWCLVILCELYILWYAQSGSRIKETVK